MMKFGDIGDLKVKPLLLGIGVFYASLLMVTSYAGTFALTLGVDVTLDFLKWAIIGAVFCGLLYAGVSFRRRGHHRTDLSTPASRAPVAVVGMVFSCVGVFLLEIPGQASPVLFALGGALFGVGAMAQILCWGTIYADELPPQNIFHTTIALLIAAVLFMLTTITPLREFSLAVYVVLNVAGTGVLCLGTYDVPEICGREESCLSFKEAVSSLWKVLWKPLLGAVLAAFIIGLVWDPVAAQETLPRTMKSPWRFLVGPTLAALFVLFFLRKSPKSFALHSIHEVFLPVAIILLLVVPFVDTDNLPLMNVFDTLNECALSVVVIVTWTSLSVAIRTTGLLPRVVLPLACAVLALSMGLGIALISFIGIDGKSLCLVLTVVYLLILILSFTLHDRSEAHESQELERHIAERYLNERYDEIAQEFGLSEREHEVLVYMGRGYSQVYIAKELYVSENTIRTHSRHIYGKLGVHSRQEMLNLINGKDFEARPET
jgi:DNA-binding CsgD family transcriptional regulator